MMIDFQIECRDEFRDKLGMSFKPQTLEFLAIAGGEGKGIEVVRSLDVKSSVYHFAEYRELRRDQI